MTHVFYSGGCEGADEVWMRYALAHGFRGKIASFDGHRPSLRSLTGGDLAVIQLKETRLNEANEIISTVARRLKRRIPVGYSYNLLRRNYFIVRHAEAVYAVGYLMPGMRIDGGTAWGCEAFLLMGGRLYFFDMNQNKWMTVRNGTEWVIIDEPPSPHTFTRIAGVGSRRITKEGENAIKSVWK